jgi:hypothetical protein
VKQLGIVAISLTWIGLVFLIRKWKGNVSMTFSLHAAQYKISQTYYLVLFSIVLPLFGAFMYGWFIPQYHLPFLFGLLMAVALGGNYIAALVPETKGKNVPIHRNSAFLAADCLVPLLLIITFSPHFPEVVRFLAGISAAYQLIGIVILYPTKGYHPKVLPLQASYVASFHLTIVAATYLR